MVRRIRAIRVRWVRRQGFMGAVYRPTTSGLIIDENSANGKRETTLTDPEFCNLVAAVA
jgi:hypothetical protein